MKVMRLICINLGRDMQVLQKDQNANECFIVYTTNPLIVLHPIPNAPPVHLIPMITFQSLEPTLIPKLRIYLAEFPYLHCSIRLEAAHLGDRMR
jgi:hypothetical protein